VAGGEGGSFLLGLGSSTCAGCLIFAYFFISISKYCVAHGVLQERMAVFACLSVSTSFNVKNLSFRHHLLIAIAFGTSRLV